MLRRARGVEMGKGEREGRWKLAGKWRAGLDSEQG